jgi:L-ascorbate metabolism protein UlaG (beta-lactamase superfamily)
MRFTYFGHSSFAMDLQGKQVVFDPFITPNPLAKKIDINSIPADYILLSHGHGDHVADCAAIAKRTNATVVSSFEVVEWATKQGVEKTHPMNHGGKKEFEFGTLKCVNAIHSSGLPDGSYGGNPMGFVITTNEKNFYYTGDTALTMDMQLIPRWAKLDFGVMCIGDNFTMGYEDAIEAAKMVQTNVVIGVHFDTFPYIQINHTLVKQAFAFAGITLHLPAIGETIEL